MRIGVDARAAAEVPAGRGRYVRELLRALAAASDHEVIAYAREPWDGAPAAVTWRLIGAARSALESRAARAANRECDVFLATNTLPARRRPAHPGRDFVHDLVAFDPSWSCRAARRSSALTLPLAVRGPALLLRLGGDAPTLVERFPRAAAVAEATPLAADARSASRADAAACEPHGLERPYVLITGTLEPRKNLPAGDRRVRGAARGRCATRTTWCWSARAAGRPTRRRGGGAPRATASARWATSPTTTCAASTPSATVFLYPSLREGFGLPVLEAMAAGRRPC